MRHIKTILIGGSLAATWLAGCSGSPTAPIPPDNNPPPVSTPGGGSPSPATAAVTVGDIFFASAINGSTNPAVDTVAVNGTVTWTWTTTASMGHSVQSLGTPSFTSSNVLTGGGNSYRFTFTAPGTYQYDCSVHGLQMTGRIVVLAA